MEEERLSGMDDYTEEEIAERLRRLPPAPAAWVRAACELPRARELMDGIVARAEADAEYRAPCSPTSRRRSGSPASSPRRRCSTSCAASSTRTASTRIPRAAVSARSRAAGAARVRMPRERGGLRDGDGPGKRSPSPGTRVGRWRPPG